MILLVGAGVPGPGCKVRCGLEDSGTFAGLKTAFDEAASN